MCGDSEERAEGSSCQRPFIETFVQGLSWAPRLPDINPQWRRKLSTIAAIGENRHSDENSNAIYCFPGEESDSISDVGRLVLSEHFV